MRNNGNEDAVFIGLIVFLVGIMVVGLAYAFSKDSDKEEACLKKGYHYVDSKCYKSIIPE